MKTSAEIAEQVRIAVGGKLSKFHPCAYFDESLDCIRVIARDCSILETRVNQYITVLEDNYEESDDKKYVGFTVKGARHFCHEHGIDLSEPVNIGNVLDKIMANSPEPAVQMTIRLVARPLIKGNYILESLGSKGETTCTIKTDAKRRMATKLYSSHLTDRR